MKVSLLTGGNFRHYCLCMLKALAGKGIFVDFIGNDEMGSSDIVIDKNVNFLNLRGDQSHSAPMLKKIIRVLKYYLVLFKYVTTTDSRLFHIQSYNKFLFFDSTILNIYYKILGKKLVFTAHNVNIKERDGGNNIINRLHLRFSYRLMDHIFVHTEKMKMQLIDEFTVNEAKITVIPHGIINIIPMSGVAKSEARAGLNLQDDEKVLLFFGGIAPYKGLEYLLHAMEQLVACDDSYKLIIAGQILDCWAYWENMERIIKDGDLDRYVLRHLRFIPDDEVEALFRASDVVVLPYRHIFQSGVPFLAYSFGLPVIAADVGALREYIVEGETGMICRKEDSGDLADKVGAFFDSELYRNLEENSNKIMTYGKDNYSWDAIGSTTQSVYKALLS